MEFRLTDSKACSRCKQVLPLTDFNRKTSTPTGKASACKKCTNVARNNLTPEQRERKNAQNKAYRQNNPQAVSKTNRQQYLNKREERIAYATKRVYENPERFKRYQQISKRRNKESIAANSRRRNARKRNNGICKISKKELFVLANSPCFYCQKTENITVDHVVAISRGGRDAIGNLVSACKSCNSSKGALTIMEWLVRGNPPTAYAQSRGFRSLA